MSTVTTPLCLDSIGVVSLPYTSYVFCVCLPDPGEAFIIKPVHLSLPLGFLFVKMIPVGREMFFTQETIKRCQDLLWLG